jgi:hypothetical protein
MKVLICFLFCITAGLYVQAQKGDSLLLNETKLTRPLNLHNKQLRFSGNHSLALSSMQYEGTKRRSSKESGRTRTFSAMNIDIQYGVTEYWQARINLSRSSEIITEPAIFKANLDNEIVIINYSAEKIGWEDPEFWLDYRLPFTGRRTDVVLSAGTTLSIMENGSEKPTIRKQQSEIVFDGGVTFEQQSTLELQGTGRGTNFFNYGLQFKHRFAKWAFNFQSIYYLPLRESSASKWNLSDTGSDYIEERYTQQQPDQLFVNTGLEFQLRPWLNITTDITWFRSRNGWNETQDQKLLVPLSRLVQTGITYEIMASKRLWIGQTFYFTVKAENIYAPLLLTSYLKYNLFL